MSSAFVDAALSSDGNNLAVALAMAAAGLPIFPAAVTFDEKKQQWKKKPRIENWQQEATTDEQRLRYWWSEWPDAVPGIELGRANLLMIDTDRHGREDGVANFAALAAQHVPLPDHPIAKTAGDGEHHYFKQWNGETFGNGEGALRGKEINVRGRGGWAVAPGSVRPDGKRWAPAGLTAAYHDNTIPLLPDWIAAMIRVRKPEASASREDQSSPDEVTSHDRPIWSATEDAKVRAALACIPSNDRATWFEVGAALHWTGWPAARSIWDAWSMTTPGAYDADDQETTWRSFDRPYGGKPKTLASLFYLAQANGYQQKAPQPEPFPEPAPDEQQQPALRILSSAEFVKGFVPPEYVVVGLLQRRFIYSCTGQTGAGKTAIMLRLAACAAQGLIFAGRETKKVRVLYAAAENPDDVRMRWIALAQHMDFDTDKIEVFFTEGRFKISQMHAKLRAEAEKHGGDFGLVVIDTSPAFFEGDDENSRTQMGAHARLLRSLINVIPGGPTVIANCHPVKNATAENLLPAGGGSFLNEIDGNLTCAKADSISEVHWQGKFRGPEFAPMSFLIKTVTHQDLKDSDGRLIPTVIVEDLSDQAKEEIASTGRRDEDTILSLIEANPAATCQSLAIAMGWKLHGGEPNKMKAHRCIRSLKAARTHQGN